jgi:hypothetical protein
MLFNGRLERLCHCSTAAGGCSAPFESAMCDAGLSIKESNGRTLVHNISSDGISNYLRVDNLSFRGVGANGQFRLAKMKCAKTIWTSTVVVIYRRSCCKHFEVVSLEGKR